MVQIDLFDIGQLVKEARRKRKMNQTELGAAAGVHRTRIDALENGRAPEISFNTVVRIMNVVGLDLRPTTFNEGRPTLDDIKAEEEEDDTPRMGR